MTYILVLLITLEIYLLVSASLDLLIGYSGLLHIAHAAYFGIGAYTVAILTVTLHLSFIPALGMAGISSGILSLLVSLPSGRLRGDSFIIVSMAVQMALYAVMLNWQSLTGGALGITAVPNPAVGGLIFETNGSICALYGFICVVLLISLTWLKLSPYGRSLQAMRDDEVAATSVGIPIRKLRIWTFFLSSCVVGISGGMYAAYASYVDPTDFTIDQSILMLSMVIVGGTGNIRGPLIGAGVLVAIPELLRFTHLPSAEAANIRLLAYGLLLVVMMRVRPQGLAGRYRFE